MPRTPRALVVALAVACLVFGAATSAFALTWPPDAPRVAVPTVRLAGPDRYSTASAIGARAYPAWSGVKHVVIASGDDRAAADPLAAASLCWAYDAPLLLTNAGRTPASTLDALKAIVSANTTVTVHVVGGPGSVPAARIAELKLAVGRRGVVEQPWVTGDRYGLARSIAVRVAAVARRTSREVPSVAFVACGERPSTFWDVLAVSAISRHTGIPVLLTATKLVPASTTLALRAMPGTRRIVVGGPGSVAPAVYTAVGADTRWGGADRYATACTVATSAAAEGWADSATFGVAVAMPDAVAGAGLVGKAGGVLLLSGRDRISRPTWQWLSGVAPSPLQGYLLGGTASATPALLNELNGAPALPALGTTTPALYSGNAARVAGSVGGNTTTITFLVNGVARATKSILPWGTFDFGTIDVPVAGVKVGVVAGNPDGKTTALYRSVARKKYVICIDPGHQTHANLTPEPIGPGSSTTKPSVSGGATGVVTRVPEYKLTLQIAMRLKAVLEARGMTVVMVRTTNDVNIPNSQRAIIADNAHANLFVRIHCDGSTSSSVHGISTLYPAPNSWTTPIAARSKTAAASMQSALIHSTGAADRGAVQRSDLSGFNWSTVPTVLVESGFLSNSAEDRLLSTAAYQDKLAAGMADGVAAYLAAQAGR